MASFERTELSVQAPASIRNRGRCRRVQRVATSKGPALAMTQLHDGFWNFRGDFRIAGVVNVGTHLSLVQRPDGRFLVLDSYNLEGADCAALLSLTDNGRAVDAILNVHPFHTLHCAAMHASFPGVPLIGTARHRQRLPELPWADGAIEDAVTQAQFADTLDFSIPAGVDFVCPDDKVHVASVLVRHRASGIVHVDDTINVLSPPSLLKPVLPEPRLRFHPMLARALQQRGGAADEYAAWARDLADRWAGTPIVCAAHSAIRRLDPDGWRAEMLDALNHVRPALDRHRYAHN